MQAVIRFTIRNPATGYVKSVDMDITEEIRTRLIGFANAAATNTLQVDYLLTQHTMGTQLPATGLFQDIDMTWSNASED